MKNPTFDFSALSVSERIQLAEDLWDSVSVEGHEVPLTAAETAELERRLDDLDRNPDAGVPWGVVRARLEERLKRGA